MYYCAPKAHLSKLYESQEFWCCLNYCQIVLLFNFRVHHKIWLMYLLPSTLTMYCMSVVTADPPGDQTCCEEPDNPWAQSSPRLQLSLHCGFLRGILQWWGNQHLYGVYGKCHCLPCVKTTIENWILCRSMQWTFQTGL